MRLNLAERLASRLPEPPVPPADARAALLVALYHHRGGPRCPALLADLGFGHLPAVDVDGLDDVDFAAVAEALAGLARTPSGWAAERRRRRARGAYYTPEWLVEAVLDHLPAAIDGPVLDPACGAGAFLRAAYHRGLPAGSLRGVDRDPAAVLAARLGLVAAGADPTLVAAGVRPGDGLLDELPDDGAVAALVGNPPWGVTIPRADYPRLGVAPPRGEPCSAALFVARGLRRLRPGGRLALVLPETWLATLRAESLRRQLLETEQVRAVDLYRKGVFPAAPDLVPTVLVVDRAAPADEPIRVRRWGFRRPLDQPGWQADFQVTRRAWLAEPRAVFAVGADPELADLHRAWSAWPRLAEIAAIHDGVYRTRLRALIDDGPIPALLHAAEVRRWAILPRGAGLTAAAVARLPAAEQARQRRPKLLLHALRKPALADRLIAAVDADGRVVAGNNLVLVLPDPASPWSLFAVAALLNSRVVGRWYADRFVQVNLEAYALGAIPLPPAPPPADLDALARRATRGEAVQPAIDDVVAELYGVTPAQRAAIDRRWDELAGDRPSAGVSPR